METIATTSMASNWDNWPATASFDFLWPTAKLGTFLFWVIFFFRSSSSLGPIPTKENKVRKAKQKEKERELTLHLWCRPGWGQCCRGIAPIAAASEEVPNTPTELSHRWSPLSPTSEPRQWSSSAKPTMAIPSLWLRSWIQIKFIPSIHVQKKGPLY